MTIPSLANDNHVTFGLGHAGATCALSVPPEFVMPDRATTLEPHELDTRIAWCDRCADWSATAVDVAVVDGRTLLTWQRYTSTVCHRCGHEDLTR